MRARTCASGRNMKITIPERSESCCSYMRMVAMQFACVSAQPFGGPVVPDVYTIVATSSGV